MARKFNGLLAVMAMLAGSLLGAGCGGGGGSSSTKPDPNTGLYGTWEGTLYMQFPGATTVDVVYFVVDKSSVTYNMSGVQYPVTGYQFADPNITIDVKAFGYDLSLTGTRAGGQLNGTAALAGAHVSGQWAAGNGTAPQFRPAAGKKMSEVLKPR